MSPKTWALACTREEAQRGGASLFPPAARSSLVIYSRVFSLTPAEAESHRQKRPCSCATVISAFARCWASSDAVRRHWQAASHSAARGHRYKWARASLPFWDGGSG